MSRQNINSTLRLTGFLTGMAVSLASISTSFATSFVEVENLSHDKSEIINDLKNNLCREPESSGTKPKQNSGSKSLEAAAGCVDCMTTETSGLQGVQAGVATLGATVDAEAERERLTREIAYMKDFTYNSSSTHSLSMLKSDLQYYKSDLENTKNNLNEVNQKLESLNSAISKFETAATQGLSSVSHQQKQELKSLTTPLREKATYAVKRLKYNVSDWNDWVEKAEEAIKINSWKADYYQQNMKEVKQRQAETQAGLDKAKAAVEALNATISWADGNTGATAPSGTQLSAVAELFKDERKKEEGNKTWYLEDLKNQEMKIKNFEAKIKALEAKNAKGFGPYQTSSLDALREEHAALEGKLDSGNLRCGLTPAESHAIYNYTASGYQELNYGLRKGGEEAEKVKSFDETLNAGLAKLRPYKGWVLRGGELPPDVLAQHQVGEVVTYEAFTSTSINNPFGSTHSFAILSKTGAYVGPLSANQYEEEVLIPSHKKFRVLERKVNSSGGIDFVLEEIED